MKNADMPAAPAGKIARPVPKGGDPLGNYTTTANGFTKRERVAVAALQGLLSNPEVTVGGGELTASTVAHRAVEYADMLLNDLEK